MSDQNKITNKDTDPKLDGIKESAEVQETEEIKNCECIDAEENAENNEPSKNLDTEKSDSGDANDVVTAYDSHAVSDDINAINKNVGKPPFEAFAKSIFDYVEIFVIAIFAVMVLFTFAFRLCRVDGPSMENTLFDGERLIISNLFYEPDYGDIVVFHQTSESVDAFNEPIIKRIIAKSGDKVDIDFDTWSLYVNGNLVTEDYKKLEGFYTLKADYAFPVEVPEGYVFVMGDNRNHSSDSRSSEIGFVDERRILGRVIVRLSPLDRFGRVE